MARAARKPETVPETVPETPAPGVGHNQPPPPDASLNLTPEQWAERLRSVFEQPTERAAEIIASFKRFEAGYPLQRPVRGGEPPIGIEKWDDDVQGRAGDLREKFAAVLKISEALHTVEKAPVLTAQRAIDGFLKAFRQPLDEAVAKIRARQSIYGNWQDTQSRNRAREEAALLSMEALAAATEAARTLNTDALQKAADKANEADAAVKHADAKPAEHTRVHGESSVTSLRSEWRFVPEQSDLMELARAVVAGKVPATYLAFNEARIRLAIRIEHVRAIPGCVIEEEKTAR